MKTIIVPTLGAEHIVSSLKLPEGFETMIPLGNKEGKRFFPDGEIYARLPDEIEGFDGRVVILHSGQPDPGNSLTELEIILSTLKRANVQNVEIFFTYFPFCMQDKTEFKGDTNFAEDLIQKLFTYYKVKKIYVLEAHFFGKEWLLKFPNLVHVSALELLKSQAEKEYGELVYVAPDIGSQKRANITG
ncbi:MAG TPA: ribose-phosphate pyrophosphokinase-like domain-containing protein, partial [Candidatus Paceibacterota bacterium]|nr:ribose-phosphate pyrophosphokinase-like domain-containing protein [Candidatus Paceibacterota bacterium]